MNLVRTIVHEDPDETVHYDPSYQDLHCLQKICFSLQDLKG